MGPPGRVGPGRARWLDVWRAELPGARWGFGLPAGVGRRGARRRGRPGAVFWMAARFGPGARTRGLSLPLAGRPQAQLAGQRSRVAARTWALNLPLAVAEEADRRLGLTARTPGGCFRGWRRAKARRNSLRGQPPVRVGRRRALRQRRSASFCRVYRGGQRSCRWKPEKGDTTLPAVTVRTRGACGLFA